MLDERTAPVPGLVARPYAGPADLPDAVRVKNAEWAADDVRARESVADLGAWWSHPSEQFDASRDVELVELDGRVVALIERSWADASDGVREYRCRGWVVPEVRRRGIGSWLLARNEAANRAMAATHDTDRPRVFELGTADTSVGGPIVVRRAGYAPVRWFADMERSLTDELPDIPPLPDGLEVRPATPDDAPAIWRADHEAFRDHWGGFDDSEASYRRWVESSEFQPDLMVVAWDGEEVAGAVLNAVYPEENEQLGISRAWLDSVFTRRAWRRRGLGRALIVRALHLLRERGYETAALGVDADNPSGAFGLYESAGFAVSERSTAWRKPMEEAR
ncbi:MAG TPA: GNAT family N-acetyltransferase [Candidatus Angelobacter sp.]|nr:GNAT family N-acetyltransferase [Candidatus Angelobacter sp.]